MKMISCRVQTSPPTYGFVSKTSTIFEPALEMQTSPADHFHLSGITVGTLRISTMHFNWRQGKMKSLVFAYVIEVFYFVFLCFPHMIQYLELLLLNSFCSFHNVSCIPSLKTVFPLFLIIFHSK